MKDVDMQHAQFQNLKEAGWRRPLTEAERAGLREYLAGHPEARESWNQEAALNALLRTLPRAAVSSNFTARVLQAVQRQPPTPAWRRRLDILVPSRWMPRVALGTAMLCCAMLSAHGYDSWHRTQVARQLVNASRLVSMLSPDCLENFDTINRLNKVRVADDDLLAVVQPIMHQ
jgi:hypothetical protein